MNELLKALYDSFYEPLPSAKLKAEIEACHRKLIERLDKPERRKPGITLQPDYTGFVIPNEFVVGYGLDFNEHYRNLPYVGVLKPEVYEK